MGLGHGGYAGLQSLSSLSSQSPLFLLLQALAPGQVTVSEEAENPEAGQRPHGQHLSGPDPGLRRRWRRRRPRAAPGGHSLRAQPRLQSRAARPAPLAPTCTEEEQPLRRCGAPPGKQSCLLSAVPTSSNFNLLEVVA